MNLHQKTTWRYEEMRWEERIKPNHVLKSTGLGRAGISCCSSKTPYNWDQHDEEQQGWDKEDREYHNIFKHTQCACGLTFKATSGPRCLLAWHCFSHMDCKLICLVNSIVIRQYSERSEPALGAWPGISAPNIRDILSGLLCIKTDWSLTSVSSLPFIAWTNTN